GHAERQVTGGDTRRRPRERRHRQGRKQRRRKHRGQQQSPLLVLCPFHAHHLLKSDDRSLLVSPDLLGLSRADVRFILLACRGSATSTWSSGGSRSWTPPGAASPARASTRRRCRTCSARRGCRRVRSTDTSRARTSSSRRSRQVSSTVWLPPSRARWPRNLFRAWTR